MMRHVFISAVCCLALAMTFSACGAPASQPPASSGSTDISVPSSASSPASSSETASGSTSAPSSAQGDSLPDTSAWTRQFVSLPVHGTQRRALLVLDTPPSWTYDDHTTFSRDDTKIAEVLNIWPISDTDAPFTAEMTDPYANSDIPYPEGYGLQSTAESELLGRPLRIYHAKTWPDDADQAWYPRYTFYVVDDYVVEIHFYSFDAPGEEDETFKAVLSTMELHFRDDPSSAASSSGLSSGSL